MPNKYLNQRGFAPPMVLVMLVIILTSGFILYKSLPVGEPQATPDKGFSGFGGDLKNEASASASASASIKSMAVQNKKFTSSSTPKASVSTSTQSTNTDSSSTNQSANTSSSNASSSNNSNGNNSNTPTNIPTATTTPTPTPAATPNLKTFTHGGNNLSATTSCQTGDLTFDVSISGSVSAPGSGKMIYGMLSGNGQTKTVLIQSGYSGGISANFNDSAGSVREGGVIELKTSGSSIYAYDFKVYSGPESFSGTPSLETELGSVQFLTDCK